MQLNLAIFMLGTALTGVLHAASARADEVGLAADASATCDRQLLLRNIAAKPVTITLPGVAPKQLGGYRIARWCASGPDVTWTASTAAWMYRGQATIGVGERRIVTVATPGATLAVTNLTGEPQALALDGAEVARLAPGEKRTLGPIVAGERQVQAKSLRSAAVWATMLKLRPGATTQLRLPAPQGALRLQNPLDELAALSVDGRALGNVEAGAKLVALGFAPGGHEVQWAARDSGKVMREVAQADDPTERASPRVRVTLHNRTGETLETPSGLRDVAATVAPRAKLTWSLPRGEYGVVLTGQRSGLPYRLDIRKRGPASLQWEIRRPVATLRLVNASGQPIQVDVPTLGPLPMGTGTRALLRVPAGKLALAARVPGRDKPLDVKMFLRGNQEAVWNIAAASTYVVAKSGWSTAVELYVDERRAGTIRPNGDYRLPLLAGRHRIEARVPSAQWRETARVDVRDGDHGEVKFTPPSGALHLDNETSQAFELWIDGRKVASVAAGRSVMLPAGPGPVYGQVAAPGQAADPRTTNVLPTQQVQVAGPTAKLVQIELINHSGATVDAGLDQADLKPLADGARRDLGRLPLGIHLVHLRRGETDLRAELRIDGSRATVQVELRPSEN